MRRWLGVLGLMVTTTASAQAPVLVLPAGASVPPGLPPGTTIVVLPPDGTLPPSLAHLAAPVAEVPAPVPAPVVAAPAVTTPPPAAAEEPSGGRSKKPSAPSVSSCKLVRFGSTKEIEKIIDELIAEGRPNLVLVGTGMVCGW